MAATKVIQREKNSSVSESSILLISFIAGVTASIITISILFVTVKKIETKFFTSANVISTAKI